MLSGFVLFFREVGISPLRNCQSIYFWYEEVPFWNYFSKSFDVSRVNPRFMPSGDTMYVLNNLSFGSL